MFHVFISYAHEDGRDYRDIVINLLRRNGFRDDDYWYDERDIEIGEEWRTQIDKALNESFIVIIVLTKQATKSHFVTYEWARAIADGVKIIPVLFMDLPKKLDHPLLERKQFIDWRKDSIPEKIVETIKEYREMPPDKIYLAGLIARKVITFRTLARVTLWLYPYAILGIVTNDLISQLLKELLDEANKLENVILPKIMVNKSPAFTSKQSRLCRKLIKNIGLFWKSFMEPNLTKDIYTFLHITPELIASVERFRVAEIESLLNALEDGIVPNGSYKRLDYHLEAISSDGATGTPTDVYPLTGEYLMFYQYNVIRQALASEEQFNDVYNAIQKVKAFQLNK